MPTLPKPGDLAAIDATDCVALLHAAPWIRVGFDPGDGPVVLPVNHVLHDDAVFFRTSPGSKLGSAARSQRVAIEADGGEESTRIAWSVMAQGTASIVQDPELVEALMALPFEPWALPEDKVFWVRIDIDTISGRRIVRHG